MVITKVPPNKSCGKYGRTRALFLRWRLISEASLPVFHSANGGGEELFHGQSLSQSALRIRLRRSRSTTSTEYSFPGATQKFVASARSHSLSLSLPCPLSRAASANPAPAEAAIPDCDSPCSLFAFSGFCALCTPLGRDYFTVRTRSWKTAGCDTLYIPPQPSTRILSPPHALVYTHPHTHVRTSHRHIHRASVKSSCGPGPAPPPELGLCSRSRFRSPRHSDPYTVGRREARATAKATRMHRL